MAPQAALKFEGAYGHPSIKRKMSDLADAISDGNVLQTPDLTIYEKFDDMGLSEHIMRGIYAYGFERPSDIQL